MIELEFNTSFPLVEGLLHSTFNEDDLTSRFAKAKNIISDNSKVIISEIERVTGFKFKEKVITFWLITGTFTSSPRPHLLNVEQGTNKIIFDVCSILSHIILFDNNFYDYYFTEYGIDEAKLEATVYLVSLSVLEKIISSDEVLNLVAILESDMFNKYIWDEVNNFKNKKLLDRALNKQDMKIFLQ